MKRLSIIVLIALLLGKFSFGQTDNEIYVFAKKIDKGILLGIEAPTGDYIFDWNVSAGMIFNKKTNAPFVKIPINSAVKNISGRVILKTRANQEVARKNFEIELPRPRISLVRYNKKLGLILALRGQIDQDNSILALSFDFFKKPSQLNYQWLYNGIHIAEKEILDFNVSSIQSSGELRVIATDPSNSTEYAGATQFINFTKK